MNRWCEARGQGFVGCFSFSFLAPGEWTACFVDYRSLWVPRYTQSLGFVPSTHCMHSTQVRTLVTSNRDQGPCSIM